MNVVISKNNQDVLKRKFPEFEYYIGEYDVNEIGNSFKNYNYDKLIIDVTAIKNYVDSNTFKQLTNYLDASRVVLLLDDNCINDNYLKGLVNVGIYNFANDVEKLVALINSPNSFNEVVGFQNSSMENNSLLPVENQSKERKCRVIGFNNITRHAGSTTLVYTIVKTLKKKYNIVGVEVDSTDFAFFNSDRLLSTISNKVHYIIDKNSDLDYIFIDTNGSNKALEQCDEVIYLVEPTTIKINKLVLAKPSIFKELFDKKIVLNKCLLNKWDIAEFENEARIKVFYALPLINERDNKDKNVIQFLNKLNIKI